MTRWKSSIPTGEAFDTITFATEEEVNEAIVENLNMHNLNGKSTKDQHVQSMLNY